MEGDVAMTEKRGEFPQIGFIFDPKLDPIKDNVKSFAVLKSLMGSDKPISLDEVKTICSETYKIDFASEELSDVIDKWCACIDRKNGNITLTKQGREIMQSAEENSERIQNDGFEWFKEEMSKRSVDKEKIENNADKIKTFFVKCVSRASDVDVKILKGMSGVGDRSLIDATLCIKRLKTDTDFVKFDEDIKESFYFIIKKLYENPSDLRINRFMYALQYTSLIRLVLPNREIIDILKNDLANKRFCLDSNTILSVIFHHDYNHYLIYDTFSKLKQFNEGNYLPLFWHNDTHDAVMHVLETSKKFCENMSFFPEDSISNICLVTSKSPIREYFKENWPNWRSFEKYYVDRYRQLKRHDTYTKNSINNIEINEDLLKKTINLFRMYFKTKGRVMKNDKELAHDSQLLVWIHLLRQHDTSKPITPNYWLVTLDNSLINFERTFRKVLFSSEEYPLCVSKNALLLLLDPYFMANSTVIDDTFDRAKLRTSATIKGIDVEPFYTIGRLNEIYNFHLNEQKRLIGQYLDEQNLRDITISYGVR